MYRRPRIIPCLTIQHYDLVKTVGFKKPRYIGDPVNSIKIFNNKGVDEMCILDIAATKENREPDIAYLHEMASEAFMPLGYGGGIKTLEQAREIFKVGFEKVAVNSLLFDKPDEVRKIVEFAGSQSVVASIDYKKDMFGHNVVFTHDGADKTGIKLDDAMHMALECGVGEILLTSIDHEGKMKGYDTSIFREIGEIDVPIILNGGAGSTSDLKDALMAGADALAVSSFFVYYGNNKAVLINTPLEEEYYEAGIYED